MPKRGDRAARPVTPGEWDIRFKETEAAKGYEELCQQVPGNVAAAWDTMRHNPSPPAGSPRHHRLHGVLATRTFKGKILDHWQIEVSGAGRIWYLVDPDTRTVWIDHAGPGHPKVTE